MRIPGVTSARMERVLQDVKADVFFILRGEKVAVEAQISKISRDEIDRRTKAYTRRNISVLWMPLLSTEVLGERYAAKDWERYLHGLYYGHVYYWVKGLELQPVKFGEHMLAPSMFANERRSKRFVSTELLSPIMITDLAPIWRNQWHEFPRVKLWCEPWDDR